MLICREQDLVARLLRPEVRLSVATVGRVLVGATWKVGPRTLPHHMMYYIAGPGAVRLRRGPREILLSPETFLWIQPNVPQYFELADTDHPAEIVFFRFILNASGRPLRLRAPWLLCPLAQDLGRWLEELLPTHLPSGKMGALTLRCLLGALIGRASEHARGAAVAPGGFFRQRKEAVLAYLHTNLSGRFNLRMAAQQVELNPDYFSRQFRKTFGVPPQVWMTRARIQHAATQLLETDMRVKQIASELGYEDLYFFSRQFKRVMGRSPRKYRETVQ